MRTGLYDPTVKFLSHQSHAIGLKDTVQQLYGMQTMREYFSPTLYQYVGPQLVIQIFIDSRSVTTELPREYARVLPVEIVNQITHYTQETEHRYRLVNMSLYTIHTSEWFKNLTLEEARGRAKSHCDDINRDHLKKNGTPFAVEKIEWKIELDYEPGEKLDKPRRPHRVKPKRAKTDRDYALRVKQRGPK
jgi:hypothetical protein